MNQMESDALPIAIVIFGASGDLTRRKLVPALHSLTCGGLLHPATRVIGVARSPLSDAAFRDRLYEGVRDYARLSPGVCKLWPRFAGRHSYLAGSYDDPETYRRLAQRLDDNVLFSLATPPVLYPLIVEQLGRAGLNRSEHGWRHIIIEWYAVQPQPNLARLAPITRVIAGKSRHAYPHRRRSAAIACYAAFSLPA